MLERLKKSKAACVLFITLFLIIVEAIAFIIFFVLNYDTSYSKEKLHIIFLFLQVLVLFFFQVLFGYNCTISGDIKYLCYFTGLIHIVELIIFGFIVGVTLGPSWILVLSLILFFIVNVTYCFSASNCMPEPKEY